MLLIIVAVCIEIFVVMLIYLLYRNKNYEIKNKYDKMHYNSDYDTVVTYHNLNT